MRTLTVGELEQVGGGALPVLALAKIAIPVVTAAATTVYVTIRALETVQKLCEEGSNSQMKTKIVDLSCTAVPRPEAGSPSTKNADDPASQLKAKFPDKVSQR